MAHLSLIEDRLKLVTRAALVTGCAGAALAGLGAFFDPAQFFRSCLLGWLLWWQIAIGCLGLAMLYQLTGGRWGAASRPFFDAGARTLLLLTVLFLPVAIGLGDIFPWADESWRASSHLNENRLRYLAPAGFLWRAVICFAVWLGLAFVLTRRTNDRDGRPNTPATQRLEGFSGVGLVLLVFTVSFAGIDWVMSLDPYYKSTLFGGIIVAGTGAGGIAAVAASVALVPGQPTLPEGQRSVVLNDLGNLMLAFVMVWTYVTLGQFLITWMGNLPEEVLWYQARQGPGWWQLITIVILLHFVLPFFGLLFRTTKQSPARLAALALLVLVMRLADIFWTIAPTWYGETLEIHWLDIVLPVAIGGLWIAEYVRNLKPRLKPFLTYAD